MQNKLQQQRYTITSPAWQAFEGDEKEKDERVKREKIERGRIAPATQANHYA